MNQLSLHSPTDGLESLSGFILLTRLCLEMALTFSRTGYTGEDGFEIFCPWEDAPTPLGYADLPQARRLPVWGRGMFCAWKPPTLCTDTNWTPKPARWSPVSAGRSKWVKGILSGAMRFRMRRPQRQIVGLRMDERAIPREHYAVYDAAGQEIGQTTSGTWSPTLKAGIALARLNQSCSEPGTRVFVDIRGRQAPATVVPLPFYRNGV